MRKSPFNIDSPLQIRGSLYKGPSPRKQWNIDCIDEELDFGLKEVILGFESKAQNNELWAKFKVPFSKHEFNLKVKNKVH